MKTQNRRNFLKKSMVLSAAGVAGLNMALPLMQVKASSLDHHFTYDDLAYPFSLTELPYSYGSLAPNIDKKTMEIHHQRHHQGYVNNLNNALKEAGYEEKSLQLLMRNISRYNDAIRNNGGGHYNHDLFWKILTEPSRNNRPSGALRTAINNSFGSFERFQEAMKNASLQRFGSGWSWLAVNGDGKLEVGSTPNQDNPLMDDSPFKGYPILGFDVWEHAYYLNYQNRRGEYIDKLWSIINWEEVGKRFEAVTSK